MNDGTLYTLDDYQEQLSDLNFNPNKARVKIEKGDIPSSGTKPLFLP